MSANLRCVDCNSHNSAANMRNFGSWSSYFLKMLRLKNIGVDEVWKFFLSHGFFEKANNLDQRTYFASHSLKSAVQKSYVSTMPSIKKNNLLGKRLKKLQNTKGNFLPLFFVLRHSSCDSSAWVKITQYDFANCRVWPMKNRGLPSSSLFLHSNMCLFIQSSASSNAL